MFRWGTALRGAVIAGGRGSPVASRSAGRLACLSERDRHAAVRRRAAEPQERWADSSLFSSNIVALSLPKMTFSLSSARISRLSAGFCRSCLRM